MEIPEAGNGVRHGESVVPHPQEARVGIGETLAKAREDAGLSVTQVSQRTRVRETIIRGIEQDDFKACGGNFYARGHIRSIARVVGIDPEPIIRAYDDTHGGAPQAISAISAFEPEAPVPFRERRSPNWSAAMAVALALVVFYGIFQVFGGGERTRTATPAARPAPAPADSAPPAAAEPPSSDGDRSGPQAAAPRKGVEVRLKAKQSSWVSVHDATNRELFSGLIRSGAAKKWTSRKRIRIVIGNGGGVRLTVNGHDIGHPGTEGQVLQLNFGPNDPQDA